MSDEDETNRKSSGGGRAEKPRPGQPGPSWDPVNLMRQVFDDLDGFAGPAQDVLLAWLLRLPEETPPASAARNVLDLYAAPVRDGARGEGAALIDLLEQVTAYDAERLAMLRGSGARRRGRRR